MDHRLNFAPDAALPHAWRPLGRVEGLRVRAAGSDAPVEAGTVEAIEGKGFAGDRHADALSPRQLLVAGTDVYRALGLPVATLRENLLVDFGTADLASGRLLRLGEDVVLWLTFQCEPCPRLERHQAGFAKAAHRHRGMLARVLRGGTVRVGDPVADMASSIPPLSDDWRARVAAVLLAVPPDQVISFRQLARLAGVAPTYCRAFPRLLGKLPPAVGGRARSGESATAAGGWSGAALFAVDAAQR